MGTAAHRMADQDADDDPSTQVGGGRRLTDCRCRLAIPVAHLAAPAPAEPRPPPLAADAEDAPTGRWTWVSARVL